MADQQAVLKTNRGDITINLFPNHAPETVANFVGLAEGTKEYRDDAGRSGERYYDGLTFHRVIDGFMIQGGCPLGTGKLTRACWSMEGHAAMEMSCDARDRSRSVESSWTATGYMSVSHVFVMEWAAILRDLVGGLLIAGAIAALVPDSFWQLFFPDRPPARVEDLGSDRSARSWRSSELRLLDRQRAAGGRAVERRDQLRRRRRVHLRRPDHPADHQHLPSLLRLAGWRSTSRRCST